MRKFRQMARPNFNATVASNTKIPQFHEKMHQNDHENNNSDYESYDEEDYYVDYDRTDN